LWLSEKNLALKIVFSQLEVVIVIRLLMGIWGSESVIRRIVFKPVNSGRFWVEMFANSFLRIETNFPEV
jgi:hypothetical protein